MTRVLTVLLSILALAVIALFLLDGVVAVLAGGAFVLPAVFLIRKLVSDEERDFLMQAFLSALLLRMLFAFSIDWFDIWTFFALDAAAYHKTGELLANLWWTGDVVDKEALDMYAYNTSQSGWGMPYFVASIYFFTGPNMLAAQFIISVFGAAIVPLIYLCSQEVFNNKNVARMSALMVAFYPSLIVWTAHLLKDGLIIFLLVLAIIAVLKLQKQMNYAILLMLIGALAGIFTLRFYIFFILVTAAVGSFVISTTNLFALVRRFAVIVIVGLSLMYLGLLEHSGQQLTEMTSLQRIQISRKDLAESADSGFGRDLDVSTTEGALTALPIGFSYLMFAPFPWQISNLRQALTMPEMIVWWASIPFLIIGLWYSLKYRLSKSVTILLFIVMLTLAYSILQGNVGTAYRLRAQLQVFYFMFIAVGWTIWQEQKEQKRLLRQKLKNAQISLLKLQAANANQVKHQN